MLWPNRRFFFFNFYVNSNLKQTNFFVVAFCFEIWCVLLYLLMIPVCLKGFTVTRASGTHGGQQEAMEEVTVMNGVRMVAPW